MLCNVLKERYCAVNIGLQAVTGHCFVLLPLSTMFL